MENKPLRMGKISNGMAETSTYESRKGTINYDPDSIFGFSSDIRNFEQFIPPGTVNSFTANADECSFSAVMLGNVTLRITEKTPPLRIVYQGNALQVNEFAIVLNISSAGTNTSEVTVTVSAAMNPFLKMVAGEPLRQFLDKLLDEMENFRGWNNTKSHTQAL